jgi:hypothetical protein
MTRESIARAAVRLYPADLRTSSSARYWMPASTH